MRSRRMENLFARKTHDFDHVTFLFARSKRLLENLFSLSNHRRSRFLAINENSTIRRLYFRAGRYDQILGSWGQKDGEG